ncbi:hypothetical protein COLO4_32197 [Corchorus olitorius]|uniref:Uncharacterized protein n=1 Tax=Corchorus olitorius TaxID=93759 RepID=A0A1R3H0F5_9ROSI|nr:hypothetical protein COLO4_32197 [Corchorus olitorius]
MEKEAKQRKATTFLLQRRQLSPLSSSLNVAMSRSRVRDVLT